MSNYVTKYIFEDNESVESALNISHEYELPRYKIGDTYLCEIIEKNGSSECGYDLAVKRVVVKEIIQKIMTDDEIKQYGEVK